MKGLLLKDLYMIGKYLRFSLVLMVVFTLVGAVDSETMFFVFYPCMICGMIPVNLLGYDERSKWDAYAATLPCTKAQYVSAKYLIGLAGLMVVLVLTGISQAVRMIVTDSFACEEYLLLLGMLVMLGCVSCGMTLPFMFRYGVEKGRMAYYVMVGLVCGSGGFLSRYFRPELRERISLNAGLPIVMVIVIGLYALSWRLSIRFWEKRELK